MQKGPHAHDDHLPAWLHVHGQEPDTLVHLYGCGELLRRVRRRSRAASAFGLPRGVSLCRCCRISYLRGSALADVDLVSPRLERNHQSHYRRPDLRLPHRRNVWMVVASIEPLNHEGHEVLSKNPSPVILSEIRVPPRQAVTSRKQFAKRAG